MILRVENYVGLSWLILVWAWLGQVIFESVVSF